MDSALKTQTRLSYPFHQDVLAAYATGTPVISGVCTVTGVKNILEFSHEGEFLDFIHGRSVFSNEELQRFWNSKRFPYLISFLYNALFKRYPNRAALLDQGIINEEDRIVYEPIGKQAFRQIMQMGGVDECHLID